MRKILVPVANFETCQTALELGSKLSEHFGADLTVLHTFTPPSRSLLGSNLASSKLQEWGIASSQVRLLELARNHLKSLGLLKLEDGEPVEKHPPQAVREGLYEIHLLGSQDQNIRLRLRDGKPVRQILEEAEDPIYDLIIMGTRGHTGLRKLLVGSIAHQVALHSPCSILVAKNLRPDQNVIVGVTARRTSLEAVRQAAMLAVSVGQKLKLVAIVPEEGSPDEAQENINRAIAHIKDFDITPESVITSGDPTSILLAEAGEQYILGLGRAKRSKMSEIFLGDLSLKILDQAKVPVFITTYPRELEEVKAELTSTASTSEGSKG